jgi:hypothetical protein
MGVAATGLLLATAGCLEPPATSSGAAANRYQHQPVGYAADYSPRPYQSSQYQPLQGQPSQYQPAPYQPPPLSPALTPETTPVVGTNAGPPPVRYLPASQPTTSLLGPQRPDWKPGGGF